MQQYYRIAVDWESNIYCGLILGCDYKKLRTEISIPGYMQKTLLKFQNPIHKNIEDALLKADLKQYGKNVKFAKEEDGTSELSDATIKVLKKR